MLENRRGGKQDKVTQVRFETIACLRNVGGMQDKV